MTNAQDKVSEAMRLAEEMMRASWATGRIEDYAPHMKALRTHLQSMVAHGVPAGYAVVPGAVWEYGGVSLIQRGTEDDRCARKGSVRLYIAAPASPQPEPTAVKQSLTAEPYGLEPAIVKVLNEARCLSKQVVGNRELTARIMRLVGRIEPAALEVQLAEALQSAITRMDRARRILTDNNPRPECNWAMLDADDIRPALAAFNARGGV